MDGHVNAAVDSAESLPLGAAVWLAMTAAMMTPVALPWARAYAALLAPAPGARPTARVWPFVAGYATVWAGFSLVMAVAQRALASAGWLLGDHVQPALGAAVLIGAGLFQFTPLKTSCLTHCRNPLSYFLTQWHNGPPSGIRLGLSHGAYCLGCCWALMLSAFAVGTMHVGWMLALAVVAVAEQRAAHGIGIGRVFGAVLVICGCSMAWR